MLDQSSPVSLLHKGFQPGLRTSYLVVAVCLSLLLSASAASAQMVNKEMLRNMRAMVLLRHDLLRLNYDRDFNADAETLHTYAVDTLLELETAWGVSLPHDTFSIYLHFIEKSSDSQTFQTLPFWLRTEMMPQRGQLHFYVFPFSDYDPEVLKPILRFQLTYLVLTHLNPQIPDAIRAGIARTFAPFSDGRHLFIGISAMQQSQRLFEQFFKPAEEMTSTQRNQSSIIAAYFMTWLWQKHPSNKITFMQLVMQNQPLNTCLAAIGEGKFQKLIPAFQSHLDSKLRFTKIFATRDFWSLCIGILILLAAVWKVIAAAKFAWSKDLGEEHAPTMKQTQFVDETEFAGPAFGDATSSEKQHPEQPAVETPKTTPPRPPKPPTKPTTSPRGQEADSEILSVDGLTWESGDEPLPNQKRPPKIVSTKMPLQPKEQPKESSWENDVDKIFDDLVLGEDEHQP